MNAVPVLLRKVHDVSAPRDAGIVDQRIDAPECCHALGDHAVDLRDAAEVGADRERAPALGLYGRRRLRERALVDIDDHDIGSRIRERQRRSLANALTCARHDDDLIAEIHFSLP